MNKSMRKPLILIPVLLALLAGGCATGSITGPDGNEMYNIESFGFLREMTYAEIRPDGTRVEFSTRSNTADLLMGVDKLIGTATATAKDTAKTIKP